MKRLVLVILAVVFICSLAGVQAIAADGIQISINGDIIDLKDTKPYLNEQAGRVLIPIRVVSEYMGANVSWDEEIHTATITTATKEMVLKEGEPFAIINGTSQPIDCAPELRGGRMYVPIRLIGEFLDMKVDWDEARQMVVISDGKIRIFADPNVLDGSSFGNKGGYQISQEEPYTIVFDPHNPDATLPFYFRISGVKHKTVTFNFQAMADEPGEGPAERPLVVFYQDDVSDDRIGYELSEEGYRKGNVTSFTHTFKEDVAYVCYTPIHTNEQAINLTRAILHNPNVTIQNLGETRFYRYQLNVIKITDPNGDPKSKKGVFFMGKEDAYEAGSLATMGIIRFLLSDEPLAAELREKFIFYIIPIFSLDGNHIGSTNYIRDAKGTSYVYITQCWGEDNAGQYPEVEMVKKALKGWHQQGLDISIINSFHSASYFRSYARMQWCNDSALRDKFYREILTGKYWKDFVIANSGLPDENERKLSYVVHKLYPHAITGSSHTDFLIKADYYGTDKNIYKTNDDIYQDGELYLRAMAELFGLKNYNNAKPLLYCGAADKNHTSKGGDVTYRVIYRDLQGRAPSSVKVVIDGVEHTMTKDPASNDYSKGVFYYYTAPLTEEVGGFYFTAENEGGIRRVPEIAEYPGPFILEK